MKKLYMLMLVFVSASSLAQDPELFLNNWRLTDLKLNGIDYPPIPAGAPYIPLAFTGSVNPYELTSQVCNELFGFVEFGTDSNTFTTFGLVQTLILCDSPEGDYELIYFQFFTGGDIAEVFSYTITQAGTAKILTIIRPGNNQAVYTNLPLSTADALLSKITLYPNPASDVLNIQFNNGSTPHAAIAIYNSLGVLCLESRINADGRVDIQSLAAGIYMAKISTDAGTFTKQFIRK